MKLWEVTMKLAICVLGLVPSLWFAPEAKAGAIAGVNAVVGASYALPARGLNPSIVVRDSYDMWVGVDNLSTEYAFASYQYSATISFGSQEIVLDTSKAISCGNGPGLDYCGLGFSNCDFAVYCYETEIEDSLQLDSLNLPPGETATLDVTLSVETIVYSSIEAIVYSSVETVGTISPVDEPQGIYLVFVGALLLIGGWRFADHLRGGYLHPIL